MDRKQVLFLLSSVGFGFVVGSNLTSNPRQSKYFSLFSVVTFPNDPCSSSSGLIGICTTQDLCSSTKGMVMGSCAAGFGSCCVHIVSSCGSTVSQNCTYIRNEGFPTGTTESKTCDFLFHIKKDICQIRLDFVTLTLANPPADTGNCLTSGDLLLIESGASNSVPSNICGTLSGQHMYVNADSSINQPKLSITTGSATSARNYQIKVSFLECGNPMRAPAGCLQYFTGTAGTMQSYNFAGGVQLQTQRYLLCIRRKTGFCGFQLTESQTSSSDPFNLFPNINTVQSFQSLWTTVQSDGGPNWQLLVKQTLRGHKAFERIHKSDEPLFSFKCHQALLFTNPTCKIELQQIPDPFMTACTMNFVRVVNDHFASSTIPAIVGGAATTITVKVPQGDIRCGGVFGAINGETTPGALQSSPGSPFFVEYYVSSINLADTQTGFSLDFVQTPCM